MNNRKGIIRISGALLEQPESIVDMVYKLKLVIVRAEYLYASTLIEYHAISPLFDEVPVGGADTRVLSYTS